MSQNVMIHMASAIHIVPMPNKTFPWTQTTPELNGVFTSTPAKLYKHIFIYIYIYICMCIYINVVVYTLLYCY